MVRPNQFREALVTNDLLRITAKGPANRLRFADAGVPDDDGRHGHGLRCLGAHRLIADDCPCRRARRVPVAIALAQHQIDGLGNACAFGRRDMQVPNRHQMVWSDVQRDRGDLIRDRWQGQRAFQHLGPRQDRTERLDQDVALIGVTAVKRRHHGSSSRMVPRIARIASK
ncbi:hypothetical protein GALL_499500 [mine drainage metagenome]|uniref:Uncharacterized protein n=1 Tax=mine drainage metagenome TaxID=410659 RepID=A0A1J5PT58_9ZZZZ